MKLPRYSERSTVSELGSVRAISPEEAAATAGAKYGAIAAGAKAIGDVMSGIAEIKAERELNNAVTDTNDALAKLKRDVDDMPVQLDGAGNVVFDADKTIKMESEARKSITSAIRGSIKSSGAKRAYDKYMIGVDKQHSATYQATQAERERKSLEANADYRRETLVTEGRFNDALDNARSNVEAGVYSTAHYNNERIAIKKLRDGDVITRILLNPESTDAEIEMLTDSLEKGKWASALGFDEPDIMLSDKEKVAYQNSLYSHESSIDTRNNKQIEDAQEANTAAYLEQVITGDMSSLDVVGIPLQMVGLSGMKYLLSQTKAFDEGMTSAPSAVNGINERIAGMLADGSLPGQAESIKQAIKSDDRIIGEDQIGLFKAVDTAVNSVSKSQPHRRVLDNFLVKLQGLTTEDTFMGSSDDRRSERVAGEQAKTDFWAAYTAGGIDFTTEAADQWIKDNSVKYYRIALSGTMAEKGFDINAMPPEKEQAYEWIEAKITTKLKAESTNWEETNPVARAGLVRDEMSSIELLMRNVWSD